MLKKRFQKKRRPYLKKNRRYRKKNRGEAHAISVANKWPAKLILRGNIGSVMPDEYFCTLKYVAVIQHNSALGYSNQIFYANSLYDPDYSHTLNHQPLGYDQMGVFYSRYQVLGGKMTIEVNNISSTVPVNIAYGFSAQNPIFLDDRYFPENPYVKTLPVGTASGSGSKKGSVSFVTKKILGHKDILENERTWGFTGGVAGANPTDFVFGFCNVIACDLVSNPNCYIRYTLEFNTRFFQRVNIGPSLAGGSTGPHGSTGAVLTNQYYFS